MSRCWLSPSSACAAPTTAERDGRRRGRRSRAGSTRRRSARACAVPRRPHRLEEVATVDGVLYVNDSKATNVASALVGIRSFPGGVHVILGGRGKGGDYAPLAAPVAERCRAAYLIGETAAELRAALEPAGVPLHDCGDLEHAVAAARAAARAGRRRAALARLSLLRPVPLVRGARRPLPRAGRRGLERRARVMSAACVPGGVRAGVESQA